jgi:hypothetical protein
MMSPLSLFSTNGYASQSVIDARLAAIVADNTLWTDNKVYFGVDFNKTTYKTKKTRTMMKFAQPISTKYTGRNDDYVEQTQEYWDLALEMKDYIVDTLDHRIGSLYVNIIA